jgi:large subunit ribosomal protein L11
MAKKIIGSLKLQVKAGQANPSPPVGPALGQRGLNIMAFVKEFNAKTADMEPGTPTPGDHHLLPGQVVQPGAEDPPASFLIKKAAGLPPVGKRNRAKGSAKPGRDVAGT